MENIQPLPIWQDGQTKEAEQIELQSNFDDLKETAVFYYCLKNADGQKIVDGNITMAGEDYKNWDGSNTGAYDWAATVLNISYL